MMMKNLIYSIASIAAALTLQPIDEANAGRRGEQDDARQQMMAGAVKSLREIEARILPRVPNAQYLGPEFDPNSKVYRLKFLREGRVIFVDVDARSGAILRRR